MTRAPTPITEPQLAVAADGSLIAHLEPDRISLVDGEALGTIGEIGIDEEADGCDVALCGDPLRLVVLSRYAANGRLHVIDPHGPSAVGEVPVRAGLRLLASSGNHVWLGGGGGATVVDVTRRELTLSPLAVRAAVAAVGGFADGHFVVSTGGMIEEWDPEHRAPARRFRLSRPTPARFVGGGARQVWMVPVDGDRLELIPLVNVGQPLRIELPEPVARIAADPSGETVAVVGATTGAIHIVDLSGKTPPIALDGVTGFDVAWLGTSSSVVVAGFGLEVVAVGGRSRVAVAAASAGGANASAISSGAAATVSSGAAAPTAERAQNLTATPPAAPTPLPARAATPLPARAATPARALTPAPTTTPAPAPADRAIAERLAAWRERTAATTATTARPPTSAGWDTEPAERGWRDELVSWTRAVLAGTPRDTPTIDDGPLVVVGDRLGLRGELAEALWLTYGAHLCGQGGVSATELIAVIGRRWDEALGRGLLAASGALRWQRGRIRLRPEVIAAVDEQPVRGTLIESPADPPEAAVAMIAGAGADLVALATWIAPQLGALLVARERDAARTARHLLAARARGVLPVLRWPTSDLPLGSPPPRALLVVADEATARAAQAPVLATWPPRR